MIPAARRECAELEEMAPELHQVAGNLAMPGFTAPKLLWVRRHEPQHFARTACVLLPKDFSALQDDRQKVSDMSDAAGTLWLDVARRDWSDALLQKCGLTRQQMPELVEGCDVSATLAADIAERWGLNPSVLVAGAAAIMRSARLALARCRRETLLSRWGPPAYCLSSPIAIVRRRSRRCMLSVMCCRTCGTR